MSDIVRIAEVQRAIGYTFRSPAYLVEALTHSSYVNEHREFRGNDRLEFLGDGLLGFIVAEELYRNGDAPEGAMTARRSELVSNDSLARSIDKMGIADFLRRSKSMTEIQVKAKADLFEALTAAIYLDSGSDLGKARKFVTRHLETSGEVNYKNKLQEYTQADHSGTQPKYDTVQLPGGEFESRTEIKGKTYTGRGRNKQLAEKQAAKNACDDLEI